MSKLTSDKEEKKSLEQVAKDLEFMLSNRLNIEQSKAFCLGIIFEILNRRDIFPKNIDLKEFVEDVFLEYKDDKEEPYRAYLYASRNLLASRICSTVLRNCTYTDIKNIQNKILDKYVVFEKEERKSKKSLNNEDLDMWIDTIKGSK